MNERVRSATPQETRDAPPVQNEVRAVRRHGERWDPRANVASEANLVETWLLYALMSALSRVHPGQRPYHIRNMMSAA